MIENEYGSKDEWNRELQTKLDKFSQIDEFHRVLAKSCQVIIRVSFFHLIIYLKISLFTIIFISNNSETSNKTRKTTAFV